VWARTDAALADGVADQLAHTSFVVARCDDNAWRVLVREEGMAHKPSLLERLSPAEILRYWSLLSPEQRAALIERQSLDVTLEGIPVVSGGLVSDTDSVFARFAGLFHAFGRLRSAVVEALHEDRPHDAEARLLGAKFDSLPVYLDGLLETTDGDPVQRYVAVLCARQLLDHVCEQWPEFCRSRGDAVERVRAQIERGAALRAELGLDGDDADAFLQWYEDQFLRWARTPDEEGGA